MNFARKLYGLYSCSLCAILTLFMVISYNFLIFSIITSVEIFFQRKGCKSHIRTSEGLLLRSLWTMLQPPQGHMATVWSPQQGQWLPQTPWNHHSSHMQQVCAFIDLMFPLCEQMWGANKKTIRTSFYQRSPSLFNSWQCATKMSAAINRAMVTDSS